MKFIDKLSKSFAGAFRKTTVHEIEVIRQSSPPDERDVDSIEQPSGHACTSDRRDNLQRLNVMAPLMLGMLQIIESMEGSVLLSSL